MHYDHVAMTLNTNTLHCIALHTLAQQCHFTYHPNTIQRQLIIEIFILPLTIDQRIITIDCIESERETPREFVQIIMQKRMHAIPRQLNGITELRLVCTAHHTAKR